MKIRRIRLLALVMMLLVAPVFARPHVVLNPTQVSLMFMPGPNCGANQNYCMSSPEGGMPYDVFGDGHPVRVPWPNPASGTGWLSTGFWTDTVFTPVIYGNHVDNTGQTGFEVLKACDVNNDGKIDTQDPCFNSLGIWFDGRSGRPYDGVFQDGERRPLRVDACDGLCVKEVDLPNNTSFPANGKTFPFGGPCVGGKIQFARDCSHSPAVDIIECVFTTLPISQ